MNKVSTIAVICLASLIGTLGYFAYNNKQSSHNGEIGGSNWSAWKHQIDGAEGLSTDPSKNPYMREAMFGLQSELPLRRIVAVDGKWEEGSRR